MGFGRERYTTVDSGKKAGGCVVGSYKEPLGEHPVLLSIWPSEQSSSIVYMLRRL
jgi:hypothetical protein